MVRHGAVKGDRSRVSCEHVTQNGKSESKTQEIIHSEGQSKRLSKCEVRRHRAHYSARFTRKWEVPCLQVKMRVIATAISHQIDAQMSAQAPSREAQLKI